MSNIYLKKTSSLWEPEVPVRDTNKIIEVAKARQDPAIRNRLDAASVTNLTTAEKHPDTMNFAGNLMKTVGLGAALGTTAYGLANADFASGDIPGTSLDSTPGKIIAGGLGLAALGRYIQQPTSRTLADITDNNYAPTNADNVRSLMNQSYRMGNKLPGSANYTIDVDKAYNELQNIKTKKASTDSISMPERDYTTSNTPTYPELNVPDRTYSPIVQNVTKVASTLELDKDVTKDILNSYCGIETGIEKIAGARVLLNSIKDVNKNNGVVQPGNPLPYSDDLGDYDLRKQEESARDKIISKRFRDLLIPDFRR